MAEVSETRPCPCQFEEIGPCIKNCTCVDPFSSHGCLRCPRYGSREQQLEAARYIAGLISKDAGQPKAESKTSDYGALLGLLENVAIAEKKASEASKPWEEMAYKVARETKGLEGYGEVRFEKTRFRIACEGTGIYSHEAWWEDFPIEMLINAMCESRERGNKA